MGTSHVFTRIKNRFQDVRTLSVLCEEAERIGRSHGVATPGSEHFVLASFDLKDGTARQAFSSLGASPEGFGEAIRMQFEAALRHAGVELPPDADPEPATTLLPSPSASRLYRSAPSGQSLVQRIASAADTRKQRSLLAADVLIAVAQEEYSIAARALRTLNITPQRLVQAASQQISRYEGSGGKG